MPCVFVALSRRLDSSNVDGLQKMHEKIEDMCNYEIMTDMEEIIEINSCLLNSNLKYLLGDERENYLLGESCNNSSR